MMKLTLQSGTSVTINLSEGVVTIGRDTDNAIVIAEESVSSHHAEIVAAGDAYLLRDLKSSNGTTVNGHLITETLVNEGDIVQFGRYDARFENDLKSDETSSTTIKGVGVIVGGTQQSFVALLLRAKSALLLEIGRFVKLIILKITIEKIKYVDVFLLHRALGSQSYQSRFGEQELVKEYSVLSRIENEVSSRRVPKPASGENSKRQQLKQFGNVVKSMAEISILKIRIQFRFVELGNKVEHLVNNDESQVCQVNLSILRDRLKVLEMSYSSTFENNPARHELKTQLQFIQSRLESLLNRLRIHFFDAALFSTHRKIGFILAAVVISGLLVVLLFARRTHPHSMVQNPLPNKGSMNDTKGNALSSSSTNNPSPTPGPLHRHYSESEITNAMMLMSLGGGEVELEILNSVAADGTAVYPSNTVANVEFALSKVFLERKDYSKARMWMEKCARDGNEETKMDARKMLRLLDYRNERMGKSENNAEGTTASLIEEPETSDLHFQDSKRTKRLHSSVGIGVSQEQIVRAFGNRLIWKKGATIDGNLENNVGGMGDNAEILIGLCGPVTDVRYAQLITLLQGDRSGDDLVRKSVPTFVRTTAGAAAEVWVMEQFLSFSSIPYQQRHRKQFGKVIVDTMGTPTGDAHLPWMFFVEVVKAVK